MVAPENSRSMPWYPDPVNFTLFGKRVFAEEINDIKDELILVYWGGYKIQFQVFLQETEERKT